MTIITDTTIKTILKARSSEFFLRAQGPTSYVPAAIVAVTVAELLICTWVATRMYVHILNIC